MSQRFQVGEKRIPGKINGNNNYIVLAESKHNSDNSWIHKCGTPINGKDIVFPTWDGKRPTCTSCGFIPLQVLEDFEFLCPNCFAPRTSQTIGAKQTNMPYCPSCELEPVSFINRYILYMLPKNTQINRVKLEV